MDPNSLKAFIRLISKEKDLPPDILKDAIEHAILAASRKQLSQYRDAVANLDIETGLLQVIVTKTVAEEAPKNSRETIGIKDARKLLGTRKLKAGEEVRVPIDPSEFGRIAAQSARQMVMQRLRDAERMKVLAEFRDKVGIMVTGIVQRFERRDVIVNVGRAEGVLPASEQPMGSRYKFNDRLRVLIVKVEDTAKGPSITLSRKTPQLVIELFKQEVPEISDGTVQIVGIAREAGVRTKIAVKSINSDVDPVGACVGMKGSRVQMVVRELENEKIDIVPWSPDTATFIRNALNPAKIVAIELDEASRNADVVVAQGNLAIAIGRKGQNTKLAAKLSGYRLDIRSENEEELAYEEIQRRYLEDFISQVEGLNELYQQAILRSSFNSVDKIASADVARLMPFAGDNESLCLALIQGAQEYMEALREMENERKTQREHEGEEAVAGTGGEEPQAVAPDATAPEEEGA
jgi:N utilization substance protein A